MKLLYNLQTHTGEISALWLLFSHSILTFGVKLKETSADDEQEVGRSAQTFNRSCASTETAAAAAPLVQTGVTLTRLVLFRGAHFLPAWLPSASPSDTLNSPATSGSFLSRPSVRPQLTSCAFATCTMTKMMTELCWTGRRSI